MRLLSMAILGICLICRVTEGEKIKKETCREILNSSEESVSNENQSLNKALTTAFLHILKRIEEIPEHEEEIYDLLGTELALTTDQVKRIISEAKDFKDMTSFIDFVKQKHPSSFKKIIDRRVYSEARKNAMLADLRKYDTYILFRLAENQDLGDFDAIRRLSQALHAPIIVSPSFSEINLIPSKLAWLFHEPNVHFLIDQGIQILKDFYVVDHGFEYKRQEPLQGLDAYY